MTDQRARNGLRAWAEASGCRLCVLFGSRATGRTKPKSDVDVAVDFQSLPPPESRLRIIAELQQALGSEWVDVVFLHLGTDPVLRFEIFRGGELIFEERPGRFIDERVRALALYEDALPFRRARIRRLAGEERVVS